MCGISGIIHKDRSPVSPGEIRRITDPIEHRGPDDEGYFFGGGFALGHRRLSILDLSPAGHQPMEYRDRYVIVYNGEIYNFLEIREELGGEGYRFETGTDTEVILAAYEFWGERCVDKFNGMWAFALYDREEEILFCSRDRFGIKPFYYAETGDRFVFGSEIKQVLGTVPSARVDTEIAIDYVVAGIEEHSERTFFEGVRKLPASHNLRYDLGAHRFEIERYYEVKTDPDLALEDEETSARIYREQLERAVKIRLRSDVKVGTCLSGGLDSSSVASLASRLYREAGGGRFSAITAKSEEKRWDESGFAKMVADSSDLDWHCIEPTSGDFQGNIDEVILTQEEPFGSTSIFMQYFVMKKAREIGCTVMLDGQGGDETLLGYEKYYPAAFVECHRKFGLWETLGEIRETNRNNAKMSWMWILKYTVGSLMPGLRKRSNARRASFVRKDLLNDFGYFDDLAERYFDVEKLQIYEIEKTNLPILLRYEDRNSMRHSVETRLPFIDYQTLETALSLNIRHKIKDGWTKHILRVAMEGKLPEEILWRRDKVGFNAPEDIWQSGHAAEMLGAVRGSEILGKLADPERLAKAYPGSDKRLQWRLYNLAKWEELFDVGIS